MSGYQTQPAVYPGFAVIEMKCGRCEHKWVGVAAVGTQGATCPRCGLVERGFVWLGQTPWAPHDGCWLTGAYRIPWWPAESQSELACEKPEPSEPEGRADEIDPYTGEPRNRLKRWLQRLQTAWWALRGEW